jgi:integrase
MPSPITLQLAIEEYLASRQTRGIAANTLRSDKTILTKFLTIVGNIQVRSIEERHIDTFFSTNSHQKESSRNLSLQKLRGFVRWAKNRDYISKDPTSDRRRIKEPEANRLFIPVERFPELLKAAEHPRDRMIVGLGLYLFLRSSEVTLLRIEDVDLDSGWMSTTQPKTKTRDDMPICEELEAELRRWLTWYGANLGAPLAGDMYLVPTKKDYRAFPGPSGKFVSSTGEVRHTLNPYKPVSRPHHAVQRSLAKIGIPTLGEGGHTLRRSGARALFDELRGTEGSDGALQQVKVMLHHKNVAMTEHYLGIAPERAQRDARLRGRPMFAPKAVADNVIEIRR